MTRMSRLLAHPAAHSCFFTSKPARRPPTLTPPLPVTQPPRCRDHNCYKHQQTNHPCTPLSPRSALRARTKKRHERRDGSGVTQDVIRYLDTHVSVAYLVCVCIIPRVCVAYLVCKACLQSSHAKIGCCWLRTYHRLPNLFRLRPANTQHRSLIIPKHAGTRCLGERLGRGCAQLRRRARGGAQRGGTHPARVCV